MGGKTTKKLPTSLTPRYKTKFNEKLGEWQFKKRFRYTDPEGKAKDTDIRKDQDYEIRIRKMLNKRD